MPFARRISVSCSAIVAGFTTRPLSQPAPGRGDRSAKSCQSRPQSARTLADTPGRSRRAPHRHTLPSAASRRRNARQYVAQRTTEYSSSAHTSDKQPRQSRSQLPLSLDQWNPDMFCVHRQCASIDHAGGSQEHRSQIANARRRRIDRSIIGLAAGTAQLLTDRHRQLSTATAGRYDYVW